MKSLGRHVLVDLWGCRHLDSADVAERALREAVEAAGVTLRDLQVAPFGEHRGVSAIAILAESHMSLHTWPELGYAAADVFTCGDTARPEEAIPVLKRHFYPERTEVIELRRGLAV